MRPSNHSTLRRLVGTSVVVLATVVPAGVAAAVDYPGPPGPDITPTSESNVKPSTSTNPSTLPFTGGDVAGLALIGVGAALAGTVLVRRSRRPIAV